MENTMKKAVPEIEHMEDGRNWKKYPYRDLSIKILNDWAVN